MKKSVYSSFLLLFFSFAVVLSYQNCGEVGGTSPFDGLDDPGEGGNGGLESPDLLRLTSSTPSVVGRVLTVQFDCDYTPFSYSNHRVYIQVSGPNNYIETWSTLCTGTTFVINKTLSTSFNAQNANVFSARLVGITSSGEEVSSENATVRPISLATGASYPPSLAMQQTQTFGSLTDGGANTRSVEILSGVAGTFYPYTAVRASLEFTANSSFTLTQIYGLLEFLPYTYNSSPFSEYQLLVNRLCTAGPAAANPQVCPTTDNNYEFFRLTQNSVTSNRGNQDIRAFPTDTRRAFQQGQTYVIDLVFFRNGSYNLKVYNKNSPGTCLSTATNCLYYDIATLTLEFPNAFGAQPMKVNLGVDQYTPAPVSNVILKSRVCGYMNGTSTPDTTCASNTSAL